MSRPAAILLPWLLALGVLAAGARWVCPDGACAVTAFDRAGLALALDWRDPALDAWVLDITWLGSLWLLLPLAAGVAWHLARRGRRRDAGFVVLALLSTAALSHLAKLWLARPRPDLFDAVVAMPADWSYPSAHTMQAAAFALALLFVAGHGLRRWWPALVLLVALVGFSRIYLQVHYPTDVLAGLVAAAFWVMGLLVMMFGPRTNGNRNLSREGPCATSS
jgi:undecaprenyl-diphosphatase